MDAASRSLPESENLLLSTLADLRVLPVNVTRPAQFGLAPVRGSREFTVPLCEVVAKRFDLRSWISLDARENWVKPGALVNPFGSDSLQHMRSDRSV